MTILTREVDDQGWRWYREGDSLEQKYFYAGVTGILDVAVPQQLKKYFVTNSKAKQEKRLIETGDIGTRIHEAIEKDLNGVTQIVTGDLEAPFLNWLKFKQEHGIKAVATETMVCSKKYGFAGTFDMLCEYDGKLCVGDVKTGFFSVKAGAQMAAYRLAAIEMGLCDESVGMVGIQIKRDGSGAQGFVFEHYDWCLKFFTSTFECWKSLYFTKLNKLEWNWLFTDSNQAYMKGKS